ncbi:MAG: hypothetical protein KA419_00730 [Acidobacteria bacterium]|nr:hypothetical protein [Acidobacteriota bacterium]
MNSSVNRVVFPAVMVLAVLSSFLPFSAQKPADRDIWVPSTVSEAARKVLKNYGKSKGY